jgi:hypothetical protein
MGSCPDCGESDLSPPPLPLTVKPIIECGECGWRGKGIEVEYE